MAFTELFLGTLYDGLDPHTEHCATKSNNLRNAAVYPTPSIICKPYPFLDRYTSNMPYFDFLDRLSSTACTEGLTGLSLRWIQPSQQHGRRIPSLSSLIVLLICSFLVSSFLTKVTQHIHSFRASGVRSSHIASAALSEVRAFRKSVGTLCTTPGEIVLPILLFYQANCERTANSPAKEIALLFKSEDPTLAISTLYF